MKKLLAILSIAVLAASCSGGAPKTADVNGRGMFIWQLFNIGPLSNDQKTISFTIAYDENSKPVEGKSVPLDTIISRLKTANITWVVIKLGDSDAYWVRDKSSIKNWLEAQKLDFKAMIDKFHENGIKVHGFQYIYGQDKWGLTTEIECAKNIIQSGVDGYFIDAEFELETLVDPTPTKYMEKYFDEISKVPEFDKITTGYTTYGELSKHFRIPYDVFEKYCDIFIPQNYWIDRDPNCKAFLPEFEATNFLEELRVYRQGKKINFTKSGTNESIIPCGSVESQTCRGVHAQGTDIVRFKDNMKKNFTTGECWWSLDWMNDSDLSTIGSW